MQIIDTITSKLQSVALFKQGFFGNKVQQWDTYNQLMKSEYAGKVTIRQKKRAYGGRGVSIFGVQKQAVRRQIEALRRRNVSEDTLYFNEALEPKYVVLQGELMRTERGLYLYGSTEQDHMHLSLQKNPLHLLGLECIMLLKRFVCERGLECIMELLERFKDHVVEFTSCSKSWGDLGWRTVIWEVRKF